MAVPLLPRTLVLSAGMHLVVAVAAFSAPAASQPPDSRLARDVWSGQAVEVDSVTLPGEGHAGPTEPAPAEPAKAAPAEPAKAAPAEPAEATPAEPAEVTPAEPSAKAASKPRAEPKPKVDRGEHAPRPRPPVAPPPASAGGERLAAATTSAPPEAGARGAFGTTGLPQGVRHLPYAFTRALPQASSGDEGWSALPLGAAGEIEISIPVDAEGKLGELAYPRPKLAAQQVAPIRHAVERTLLLLRAGTFSLAPDKFANGVQRLRVEFEVSELPGGRDDVDHFQKAFVPPEGGRPGRSIFVSSSGRRVEARVYLLP